MVCGAQALAEAFLQLFLAQRCNPGVVIDRRGERGQPRFSTSRPGTRWNSGWLLVTRVNPGPRAGFSWRRLRDRMSNTGRAAGYVNRIDSLTPPNLAHLPGLADPRDVRYRPGESTGRRPTGQVAQCAWIGTSGQSSARRSRAPSGRLRAYSCSAPAWTTHGAAVTSTSMTAQPPRHEYAMVSPGGAGFAVLPGMLYSRSGQSTLR